MYFFSLLYVCFISQYKFSKKKESILLFQMVYWSIKEDIAREIELPPQTGTISPIKTSPKGIILKCQTEVFKEIDINRCIQGLFPT